MLRLRPYCVKSCIKFLFFESVRGVSECAVSVCVCGCAADRWLPGGDEQHLASCDWCLGEDCWLLIGAQTTTSTYFSGS